MTGFVHAVTAKAFAGFLFLAIVFGVGLFLIYRSVEGLNPAVQRIREPNKIVELWGDAIKNVNVAATYMRSYLLTVDPAMLEKFDAQRDTIASELDTLRLLSLNNPERSERADSLVILLDQKLEEMTLGVVASQGDAMSAAIDDAVKQLDPLERKREQEEEVSTARDSVAPQPKAEEKKKKNFFQRIMLNKQKKKSADTDMDIVQLASMLDSIIVADTIAAVSDTVNHTLLIAEQLAEAKTKDYQNREVQLKDELRMLAQMRTTDSTIQALSTRMLRAEQEATADLIAQASTEVRKSSDYIITVLAGGAILLIVFFTVIIRRDVGRSAQLQRQIDQARINAEQLAKTREEFAANMSHEIRSPLNAIIGISEQLSKTSSLEQQKLLEGLIRSSQHLLGLINPVLDVTRLNANKIEFESQPFKLREVMHDVQYAFNQAAVDQGIKLLMKVSADVPEYVLGDEVRLRQIMFNLVSNAIKFTDHGSVTITCDKQGETADGECRLSFQVADTGIGIERESLARIFEEYTQANRGIARKFGGTGLGLSITRKLVEQQDGTITVTSEPGRGTVFHVALTYPIVRTEEPIVRRLDNNAPHHRLKGKNILVCDDEDMNRMLAVMVISNHGGFTVECASGEEALEKIHHLDFDLILMDLNLPGIDGKSVVALIRADGKKLPIIAVTGNAHEQDSIHSTGFNGIIIKPYQEAQLVDEIVRHLG